MSNNSFKRWNDKDRLFIIDSIKNNDSIFKIANLLERTESAINAQLFKILETNDNEFKDKYNKFLIDQISNNYKAISNNLNGIKKESKNLIKSDNLEIKLLLNNMISVVENTKNLNEEQTDGFILANRGKNLFITGSGGTGKSFLIKEIIKNFNKNKKKIGITGSTGAAASLIGGTTIHSFLKIGLAKDTAVELYEKLKFKNLAYIKKLKALEILIIDEISMIDNILFSKICKFLSLVKEINKPFGNIQLILCGDFCQLPPIQNTYCFESKVWGKLNLNMISLTKQIRQDTDNEFKNILSKLRFGNMDDEIFNKLKLLKKNKLTSLVKPTILYSKNVNINEINSNEYNKLIKENKEQEYKFKIRYDEFDKKIARVVNGLESDHISLCKGLQVMITNNIDIPNNLVNGTRCVITDIDYPNVTIKTFNNKIHNISYFKYVNEFDESITYEFIPLKLAYSISIHKSQGNTIDLLEIDLGNDIFEYGMGYVALSRGTKLENIKLINISKDSFRCHPKVIEFYNNIS